MLTKQFHDEAVSTEAPSGFQRIRIDSDRGDYQNRSIVLPLMIRLLLNDWITDKERVFLDAQAPTDCLTFLTNRRKYIHPEDLELFPFEVIEATSLHGGEAIFSHRYQPAQMKEGCQPYRIFSAAINPNESDKIVLGFFGPSHRMGNIDEDCGFARLVYQFRDVYAEVKDDVENLRMYLERTEGTLLVNRTSGRTLALNESASRILSRPETAIVDISLDQLKYHIKPLLPEYNLKMENVSAADLGLSVVTLQANSNVTDNTQEVLSELNNEIVTGAARIGLVSSQLAETAGKGDNETRSMAASIQQEVEQLDLVARQFAFALNRDQISDQVQSVQGELHCAVRQTAEYTGQETVIVGGEDLAEIKRLAQQGTYRLLFESILDGQFRRSGNGCESVIRLEAQDDGSTHLRFETTLASESLSDALSTRSERFINYLAGVLNAELVKSFSIEDNLVLTELIIKP